MTSASTVMTGTPVNTNANRDIALAVLPGRDKLSEMRLLGRTVACRLDQTLINRWAFTPASAVKQFDDAIGKLALKYICYMAS